MLFIRMVILPFFVAFALALAGALLTGVLGLGGQLSGLEWAAFMIPLALMTSGYFGVKTVVQELARAQAALKTNSY
jgi:hypothetical protein